MSSKLAARLAVALAVFFSALTVDAASVWKVTGPKGGTLYLGGSIHALRSSDYPLPSAYDRALEASSQLVLEVDAKALEQSSKGISKAGQYPKGDRLKQHVDARTYAYLQRFFSLLGVPEDVYSRYKPWYLELQLEVLAMQGRSEEFGVEAFLRRRARAKSKRVSGLESSHEHMNVFAGLTDRQGEAYLLLFFIPASEGGPSPTDAWRRGDAEAIARRFRSGFQDYPSLYDRIIAARNRNWIPKLESYLSSGQTYYVVVGAAHIGGSEGVISLLRARGCKIEQL